MSVAPPEWWVAIQDEPTGPYGLEYLRSAIQSGRIPSTHLACPVGAQTWRPIVEWPPLFGDPAPPATLKKAFHWAGEDVWEPRVLLVIAWYFLAVNPFLWLVAITFSFIGPSPFHSGTAASVVYGLSRAGFLLASLFAMAGNALGGWKLRREDRTGMWWIFGAVGLDWVIGGLSFVMSLVIEALTPPESYTPAWVTYSNSAFHTGVLLTIAGLSLLSGGMQLMSVLWLWLRPPGHTSLLRTESQDHHATPV